MSQNWAEQRNNILNLFSGGSNFEKAFNLFGADREDNDGGDHELDLSGEDDEYEDEDMVSVEIGEVLDDVPEGTYQLPPRLRCSCHRLNLVAKKDVDKSNMSILIKRAWRAVEAKCNALFNIQGRSTKGSDSIRKHCGGRLFVVPNATRWTSEFNAYQRLREHIEKKENNKLNGLMDELGKNLWQ